MWNGQGVSAELLGPPSSKGADLLEWGSWTVVLTLGQQVKERLVTGLAKPLLQSLFPRGSNMGVDSLITVIILF